MATNTEPQWYQDMIGRSTTSYAYDPADASVFKIRDPGNESNNIVLNAGQEEMLKVTEDGFYVRGVRIEQDEHEAQKVYECFREWLTWSTLNRT